MALDLAQIRNYATPAQGIYALTEIVTRTKDGTMLAEPADAAALVDTAIGAVIPVTVGRPDPLMGNAAPADVSCTDDMFCECCEAAIEELQKCQVVGSVPTAEAINPKVLAALKFLAGKLLPLILPLILNQAE